jgi:hypothetical protein
MANGKRLVRANSIEDIAAQLTANTVSSITFVKPNLIVTSKDGSSKSVSLASLVPSDYIKDATVSGTNLILTKQDGSTITVPFADPDAITQSDLNNALAGKANTTDVYTKPQVDGLLNDKADKSNTYTKPQVDALIQDAGSFDPDTLAKVATTGSYNDLLNKPTVSNAGASGDYNDLINKPNLADVATSGSYNDLLNKPDLSTLASKDDVEDLPTKDEVVDDIKTATDNLVATVTRANDILTVTTSNGTSSTIDLADLRGTDKDAVDQLINDALADLSVATPDDVADALAAAKAYTDAKTDALATRVLALETLVADIKLVPDIAVS